MANVYLANRLGPLVTLVDLARPAIGVRQVFAGLAGRSPTPIETGMGPILA